MVCNFGECSRDGVWRGYCPQHYKKLHAAGILAKKAQLSAEERFWAKVDRRDPGECWHWLASLDEGGYGRFSPSHDLCVKAHRWSYENRHGAIPDGLSLDHLCHTREIDSCDGGSNCLHRRCVNPDHLEPVTTLENLMRGNTPPRRNSLKTRCPSGHPYDAANTYVHPRNGRRSCRACQSVRQIAKRAAQKA